MVGPHHTQVNAKWAFVQVVGNRRVHHRLPRLIYETEGGIDHLKQNKENCLP
jgi:hypothetical protein